MRNDAFLWYLIGRRRGRREALRGLEHQRRRSPVRALFLFVFAVLFIGAVICTFVLLSAALGRVH